jgi:hypothetical protein
MECSELSLLEPNSLSIKVEICRIFGIIWLHKVRKFLTWRHILEEHATNEAQTELRGLAIGPIGTKAQNYAKSSQKRCEKWEGNVLILGSIRGIPRIRLGLLGVEVYLPRVIEYYPSCAFDA